MNLEELQAALAEVPLGGLRFYQQVGSTNDEAASWASDGAADFALVVADEQTAGRGRSGNKWFTPSGAALAFSFILRPTQAQLSNPGRLAGLGALAVSEACEQNGLQPVIKWPNDVLLSGRKLAGVLVESVWLGKELEASIMGVGVNVLAGAVPPANATAYPATSLETELGHPMDRIAVLRQILRSIWRWRGLLGTDEFIRTWEAHLAFRSREVTLTDNQGGALSGTFLGLDADGSARLEANHRIIAVRAGEMSLRLKDDRMS